MSFFKTTNRGFTKALDKAVEAEQATNTSDNEGSVADANEAIIKSTVEAKQASPLAALLAKHKREEETSQEPEATAKASDTLQHLVSEPAAVEAKAAPFVPPHSDAELAAMSPLARIKAKKANAEALAAWEAKPKEEAPAKAEAPAKRTTAQVMADYEASAPWAKKEQEAKVEAPKEDCTKQSFSAMRERLAKAAENIPPVADEPTPEEPKASATLTDAYIASLPLRERLAARAELRAQQQAKEAAPNKAKAELLEQARAMAEASAVTMPTVRVETNSAPAPEVAANDNSPASADNVAAQANRKSVTLNAKQLQGVEQAKQGSSVLIGPAGTGKTTSVRSFLHYLLFDLPNDNGTTGIRRTANFKRQNGGSSDARVSGCPNFAVCSFTKRAVANIKEACLMAMPELKPAEWCFQSIHNLLEFTPERYTDYDAEGNLVEKMRFAPQRHAANKLDIDYLVIEEASLIDLELGRKLMEALPRHCRILYLGDINQLKSIFGLPMLIYGMAKLPVTVLDEVYRTKIGPVLNGAHNVLKGEVPEWGTSPQGNLTLYMPWQNENGKAALCNPLKPKPGREMLIGEYKLLGFIGMLMEKLHDNGQYDPEQDMIITPFNVGDLGSDSINANIAQFLGMKRGAIVHEVLAGFNKQYLAVGDRIMFNKQDGRITDIQPNPRYMGTAPKLPGKDLTRLGVRIAGMHDTSLLDELDADSDGDSYANYNLETMADTKDGDAKSRAASYVVTIAMDDGEVEKLDTAGDFAADKFSLGYALTGHKAQGSEFRDTYVIMHKRHHTLVNREWFYTAITRTKRNCTVIANTATIDKAVRSQSIPGDTTEAKLEWFTADCTNIDQVAVTPEEYAKLN